MVIETVNTNPSELISPLCGEASHKLHSQCHTALSDPVSGEKASPQWNNCAPTTPCTLPNATINVQVSNCSWKAELLYKELQAIVQPILNVRGIATACILTLYLDLRADQTQGRRQTTTTLFIPGMCKFCALRAKSPTQGALLREVIFSFVFIEELVRWNKIISDKKFHINPIPKLLLH